MQSRFTPYKSYYTKDLFQPYNPVPNTIKKLTDQTQALYEELLEIKTNLNMERLKLQERRLLALAEHELKHFFGKPYENNYYTGRQFDGQIIYKIDRKLSCIMFIDIPGIRPTSFPGSLFFQPIAFGGRKRDPGNEVGIRQPGPGCSKDD